MKRVAVWLLYFGVALGVRAQSPDAEFLQVYSVMQQGETFERSGQPSDAMDRFQTAQRELQKFAKAYPNWNEKLIKFRLSYLAGKIGSLTMKKVEPSPGGAIPGATVPRVDASAPQAIGLSSSDRERLERAESRVAEAEAKADRALRTADEATARANRADERTAQLALDLRLARDRVEVLQATEQNLSTARNRLESERTSLQARLKEALAPKPAAQDPAGNKASGKQLVYSGQPEPYVLIYQMGRANSGEWQLRNIVIEGVNLGEIYRSQFEASARKNNGDLNAVIDSWTAVEVKTT